MKMLEDGTLVGRPGDDDPDAIALMRRLSVNSRERWPGFAWSPPAMLPEPAPTPTHPPEPAPTSA
jgi:hypothetical protein